MIISVIIPMYNAADTIIRALDSVINQTYSCNYQVIIINDGSYDDSAKLVKAYIAYNTKIPSNFHIILLNVSNGGVSKARNIGLKHAKGEFIAFLDSDDEWLPNKIQEQIKVFEENPEVDVLATNRNEEHFEKFLTKKFMNLTELSSKLLLLKNFLSPPTVMMRKNVISEVGFFEESQKYAEEGNYWIRVCDKKNCYLLNKSLVITGGGKPNFGYSGLSSNLWEMEKGELKNIRLALNMKVINIIEFIFLYFYSLVKYIRRIFIVSLRK